jgi:exocyst complex component 4
VEERHLHHADASTTKQHHRDSISNVVMYSLDKADNEAQNEILKDFLWTLYSKLEAVLRGHRVLEDSARKIQKVRVAFYVLLCPSTNTSRSSAAAKRLN